VAFGSSFTGEASADLTSSFAGDASAALTGSAMTSASSFFGDYGSSITTGVGSAAFGSSALTSSTGASTWAST